MNTDEEEEEEEEAVPADASSDSDMITDLIDTLLNRSYQEGNAQARYDERRGVGIESGGGTGS
jgi:hypothetical protein